MTRETADEVAGAVVGEGDDNIPRGIGGEGAGGVAGVVVCFADLEEVVRLRGVLEHDLVVGMEVPGGRPCVVVGAEVPSSAGLADVVDRRGRGAYDDGHRSQAEKTGSCGSHCGWNRKES